MLMPMDRTSDTRITRFLLKWLGPAHSSPTGEVPDNSGYGKRPGPRCGQPFDAHRYDRSDGASRVYCPKPLD